MTRPYTKEESASNYAARAARDWFQANVYYADSVDMNDFAECARREAEESGSLDFSLRALYSVWVERS